ncbi:MAG: DsbA family protein [Deinococcus sp.]|nr:DsbA family protein [Deinococcus sp.]
MQRKLFAAVLVFGLLLAILLFAFLKPKSVNPSGVDQQGARFVFGPESATVTVVDFSNYLCPHCRDHALESLPLIKRDYIDTGKIRYLVRDFPFPGQDNVVRAGEAAACAFDQGRFWEYHEALYRAQDSWRDMSGKALDRFFVDVAGQLGLSGQEFSGCLDTGKKRAGVEADQKLADRLGLRGTPTFYINGELFSGFMEYARWKELLDKALAGTPEKGAP